MSWDKNTVNCSSLDAIKDILGKHGIPYKISTLTTVEGRGLNDDFCHLPPWELRRLEHGGYVTLEWIEQDADCDTDDIIQSETFFPEEEPKDWQPIRQTDKTGQCSPQEEDK